MNHDFMSHDRSSLVERDDPIINNPNPGPIFHVFKLFCPKNGNSSEILWQNLKIRSHSDSIFHIN